MSSHTNWCSEDDVILIDFVRNHEGIYNMRGKGHRNTHMKQKWWCEIGEILNKTDSDCCKRWSYIRDYYIRRRGKPGTSGEAARKRSAHLSFLDNLPSSQNSTNAIDENPRDSNVYDVRIEDSHSSSGQIYATEDGKMENSHSGEETVRKARKRSEHVAFLDSLPSSHSSIPNVDENLIDSSENDVKIKYIRNHSEHTHTPAVGFIKVENSYNSEETLSEDDTRETGDMMINKKDEPKTDKNRRINAQESLNLLDCSQNDLDENDLFFGSMTKIVKKLPRYEQAQLRMQIGSLIGAAELRHISNN